MIELEWSNVEHVPTSSDLPKPERPMKPKRQSYLK